MHLQTDASLTLRGIYYQYQLLFIHVKKKNNHLPPLYSRKDSR
jgi:hypothetical protein